VLSDTTEGSREPVDATESRRLINDLLSATLMVDGTATDGRVTVAVSLL